MQTHSVAIRNKSGNVTAIEARAADLATKKNPTGRFARVLDPQRTGRSHKCGGGIYEAAKDRWYVCGKCSAEV